MWSTEAPTACLSSTADHAPPMTIRCANGPVELVRRVRSPAHTQLVFLWRRRLLSRGPRHPCRRTRPAGARAHRLARCLRHGAFSKGLQGHGDPRRRRKRGPRRWFAPRVARTVPCRLPRSVFVADPGSSGQRWSAGWGPGAARRTHDDVGNSFGRRRGPSCLCER